MGSNVTFKSRRVGPEGVRIYAAGTSYQNNLIICINHHISYLHRGRPGTPAVSAARQVMISTRVVLSDVAFAPTRVRYPFLRKVSEDSLSIKRGPHTRISMDSVPPLRGGGGYPPTPPPFSSSGLGRPIRTRFYKKSFFLFRKN